MTDRRARLRQLVAEVLERVESDGLAALEAACREHPEWADDLRRRVRGLVAAGLVDTEPSGPADDGNGGGEFRAYPTLRVGSEFGRYRLTETLGAGGMGVVYRAVDADGRSVALKLIRPELLHLPGARARFEREIEVVRRLRDPGIVSVHDVGAEDDVPFLAMEFVAGRSLERVIDRLEGLDPAALGAGAAGVGPASVDPPTVTAGTDPVATAPLIDSVGKPSWTDQCVRWVAAIARALGHAHDCGVLHRDIKPSNLMLGDDGRVLVLDFGLAAAEGSGSLTDTGAQLGSLPYMAPELLIGGARAASVRSDVYSLGTVLYELLTLHAPFGRDSSLAVRDSVLRARPEPVNKQNSAVGRDLATVVEVAMERDAGRRYASMREFAHDLDAIVERGSIRARPSGRWLAAVRAVRRHPTRSTAIVLGAVLCIAAPLSHFAGAWSERDAAEYSSYRARVASAAASLQAGDSAGLRRHLSECLPALRGWEWRWLQLRTDTSQAILATDLPAARGLVAFGRGRVATVLEDGSLRAFALDGSGLSLRVDPASTETAFVAIAARGPNLFAARRDGVVEVRRSSDGGVERELRLPRPDPDQLALPTSSELVACYADGRVHVVDVSTGASKDAFEASRPVDGAAVFRGGTAFVDRENRLVVRDFQGRQREVRGRDTEAAQEAQRVAWGDGGYFFALIGNQGPVLGTLDRTADQPTERSAARPEFGALGRARSMARDQPGMWLATGHEHGSVAIWSFFAGRRERVLIAHEGEVSALTWLPGQRELVTAGRDGTLRLWSRRSVVERRSLRPFSGQLRPTELERVTAVAAHPTEAVVAIGHGDGSILLVDSLDGYPRASLHGHMGRVQSLAFDVAQRALVSASEDGTVRVFDLDQRRESRCLFVEPGLWRVALLGRDRILCGREDGRVVLFEGEQSRESRVPVAIHELKVVGERVIVRTIDGRRFVANRGTPLDLQAEDDAVPGLLGSDSRREFFTLGAERRAGIVQEDGRVAIHDLDGGQELMTLTDMRGEEPRLWVPLHDGSLLVVKGVATVEVLPVERLSEGDLRAYRRRGELLLPAVHRLARYQSESWRRAELESALESDADIANPSELFDMVQRLIRARGNSPLAELQRARRIALRVVVPGGDAERALAVLGELASRAMDFAAGPSMRELASRTRAVILARTNRRSEARELLVALRAGTIADPLEQDLVESLAAERVPSADQLRQWQRSRDAGDEKWPAAALVLLELLEARSKSR